MGGAFKLGYCILNALFAQILAIVFLLFYKKFQLNKCKPVFVQVGQLFSISFTYMQQPHQNSKYCSFFSKLLNVTSLRILSS